MRVLVCGGREWGRSAGERNFQRMVLDGLLLRASAGGSSLHIIEGGQVSTDRVTGAQWGADWVAAEWVEELIARKMGVGHNGVWDENQMPFWAEKFDLTHEQFKADWNQFGKGAGMERNARMLAQGDPDMVLAFKVDFNWDLDKGGTENMVKLAKAAGKPVYVHQRA